MSGEVFSGVVASGPQLIAFLENGTPIEQVVTAFFVLIALLWCLTILRVAKDVLHRTESTFFHIFSLLLVVFFTPIVGLPLYLIIRPVKYRYEKILHFQQMLFEHQQKNSSFKATLVEKTLSQKAKTLTNEDINSTTPKKPSRKKNPSKPKE